MSKDNHKQRESSSAVDFSYRLNETGEYREAWRIFRIMAEFVEGYQFLRQFEKEVTILGSARLAQGSKYYNIAYELGKLLGANGYATITGGGPSIMEAANKGATESGGESVGLNIQLPFEQRINPYVKKSTAFYYFFTRKVMLTSPAHGFVFFPGGYGTMDEFFEVADMIELGKMHKMPVVLVGGEYWRPLMKFMEEQCAGYGCIPSDETSKWHLVETAQEAFEIIQTNKPDPHFCELHPNNFHCEKNLDWKIFRIMAELVEGFEFLTGLVEDVTVLGTKSIKPDSPYYLAAYHLGRRLAEEKFTVVTGGASGVAEAANKGALEVGGKSLAIAMEVNKKARVNPYVTKSIIFRYPFTRKVIVTAPSKAFVCFPGGLGTMHHFFEVLTLIETKKMQKVPVLLYDKKYWQPLKDVIDELFVKKFKTIGPADAEIFQIVDDEEEMVRIIKEFRK